MDTSYSKLVDLQVEIIQNTTANNYPVPTLDVFSVNQLQVGFTKEEADDILRTIRRSVPSKKAGKLTSSALLKVCFTGC